MNHLISFSFWDSSNTEWSPNCLLISLFFTLDGQKFWNNFPIHKCECNMQYSTYCTWNQMLCLSQPAHFCKGLYFPGHVCHASGLQFFNGKCSLASVYHRFRHWPPRKKKQKRLTASGSALRQSALTRTALSHDLYFLYLIMYKKNSEANIFLMMRSTETKKQTPFCSGQRWVT